MRKVEFTLTELLLCLKWGGMMKNRVLLAVRKIRPGEKSPVGVFIPR
jgi:hypothetical protein